MRGMLATTGRLLARYWPQLLAWYLAGELLHLLSVEFAARAAMLWAPLGGFLLVFAAISRLISFVAILLIVRDGLPQLNTLAPAPIGRVERRRFFVEAMTAACIPFLAFYVGSGYLRDDFQEFAIRVQDLWQQSVWATAGLDGSDVVAAPDVATIGLTPIGIAILVVAFLGRQVWQRWGKRLPGWSLYVSMALEALWTFYAARAVVEVSAMITTWVDGRVAIVWFGEFKAWLAGVFAPLVWLWDLIDVGIGAVTDAFAQPVAWMTIASVVYGVALAKRGIKTESEALRRARKRWDRLNPVIRRVAGDARELVTARFTPLWDAFLLMFRAGAHFIGIYVLLYSVARVIDPLVGWAIVRAIGPQDTVSFWVPYGSIILAIVPVLIEPLRLMIVAAAYDTALTTLSDRADKKATEVTAEEPVSLPAGGDVLRRGDVVEAGQPESDAGAIDH